MALFYFILALKISFIFCGDPPNIYRWMADNAYIFPQLCLDDYTLRYANAFPEELERAKARAENRLFSQERGGGGGAGFMEPGSETRFHGLDMNRLSKSRPNIAQENRVDNELVTLPPLTTTATTIVNPLISRDEEANQVSPPFATASSNSSTKDFKPDFQDITAETTSSTTLPESTNQVSALGTRTTRTTPTLPLTVPILLPMDHNDKAHDAPTLTGSTTNEELVVVKASIRAEDEKGETESVPEELNEEDEEEEVRDIPVQKQDPCQDLDRHCAFWATLGECELNPFWMRPHCQRSCHSCGEEVDTVFAPTPRKGKL
ncbi:unnamed protein product [Cylicocyclus nassatus]|uniref:ShKT domain-containing protein n=1 Tax=Cylicocyclus nassatus TaxID=53992 RepID=A0AA36HHI2_CYLNA|nr:unnamed protein product [Cylicocyclus nassatus]